MSPNEALVPTASGLFGLIVSGGSGVTWVLRICNINGCYGCCYIQVQGHHISYFGCLVLGFIGFLGSELLTVLLTIALPKNL